MIVYVPRICYVFPTDHTSQFMNAVYRYPERQRVSKNKKIKDRRSLVEQWVHMNRCRSHRRRYDIMMPDVLPYWKLCQQIILQL